MLVDELELSSLAPLSIEPPHEHIDPLGTTRESQINNVWHLYIMYCYVTSNWNCTCTRHVLRMHWLKCKFQGPCREWVAQWVDESCKIREYEILLKLNKSQNFISFKCACFWIVIRLWRIWFSQINVNAADKSKWVANLFISAGILLRSIPSPFAKLLCTSNSTCTCTCTKIDKFLEIQSSRVNDMKLMFEHGYIHVHVYLFLFYFLNSLFP